MFQCCPSKFSDLAVGFVTNMWPCVVFNSKNPAFADVVERDKVELEVYFGLPHTHQGVKGAIGGPRGSVGC